MNDPFYISLRHTVIRLLEYTLLLHEYSFSCPQNVMKMINIYEFPVVCNKTTVWEIDRHATAAITVHNDNQCYASLFLVFALVF